ATANHRSIERRTPRCSGRDRVVTVRVRAGSLAKVLTAPKTARLVESVDEPSEDRIRAAYFFFFFLPPFLPFFADVFFLPPFLPFLAADFFPLRLLPPTWRSLRATSPSLSRK